LGVKRPEHSKRKCTIAFDWLKRANTNQDQDQFKRVRETSVPECRHGSQTEQHLRSSGTKLFSSFQSRVPPCGMRTMMTQKDIISRCHLPQCLHITFRSERLQADRTC
jgi:hypothetical protein